MKNTSLLILITILTFSACKKEEKIKLPVLMTTEYDTIIEVNSKKMLVSEPVVYGVNVKDTLKLSGSFEYLSHDFDELIRNEFNKPEDNILIFVDTDQLNFHSNEMNFYSLIPPPLPPVINDKESSDDIEGHDYSYNPILLKKLRTQRERIHYKTLPVYIFNNSESDIVISKPIVNGDLFMQVQAKDKNRNWKPIEYNYVPGFICGTGHQDYLLKPKHFIISTIKKYSGDYKTTMRVKFMTSEKIYYSNEFEGRINYSQFEKIDTVTSMEKRFPDSINGQAYYKRKLIFLNYD
ncbi:MAG: hypothetical protein WBF67_00195 [Olleya sp.]